MANRPIIDIDVASEPFERFKRLFDQYVKDVDAVNAEWKAMMANSNSALKPLSEYADRAAKAHQRLTTSIQRTGAANFVQAGAFSSIQLDGATFTFTGTPAYSGQTALAGPLAVITAVGTTLSGAATGTRYLAQENGVIHTNGAGANFFPGSVAGSVATGGQYT